MGNGNRNKTLSECSMEKLEVILWGDVPLGL